METQSETARDTKKWCTNDVRSCYIHVNTSKEENDLELGNEKQRAVSLFWGTSEVSHIYHLWRA